MKRFSILVIAIMASITAFAYRADAWPTECQGKPPHYLVGLSQPKDQMEVFHQFQQVRNMSIADSNSRALFGANLGEKTEMTFYGHKLTLYLPMYRRVGTSVYYDSTAGTTKLTEQEFACVKADLRQWIQESIDSNYHDYKNLSEEAIKSFAKRNGKSPDEVRAMLNKVITEYGTTYGEVIKIPLLHPVDFIDGIKEMYFTAMRSCNAAVMLRTVVMFTPCVRKHDYVLGKPSVMKHELTHANGKLQGYPIGWYVNMELMAALLPFLEQPTNLEDFFYHTYLMTPWEVLEVFGNFDIEKVRKEIFHFQVIAGGSALNVDVLKKYLPDINRAAQWLRESGQKVIAEFYSDPHAWLAVNDMSYDDDMMYRVMMAKLYEPTLLGGHANTVRFILKHSDESPEVAKTAWEQVGKPKSKDEARRAKLAGIASLFGFDVKAFEKFGRLHGLRTEQFEHMDPETLRKLFSDFVNQKGLFQHQGKGVR